MLQTALLALQPSHDDPLPYLADLFDTIRPTNKSGRDQLSILIMLLKEKPELADGLRSNLLRLFSQRHAVLLLATSGIYPATGVFAETLRRISHRILPEVDDEIQLKDALRVLLRASDAEWLQASANEEWCALIALLGFTDELKPSCAASLEAGAKPRDLMADVLEALRVVAHRIAAAGLEPEMLRLDPSLENHASPFLSVCEEALELSRQLENSISSTQKTGDSNQAEQAQLDARQLDVLIDQARMTVDRVRRRAQLQGASFYLTFRLHRLDQHLNRLDRLTALIASYSGYEPTLCSSHIAELWRELAVAECSQNNVREFWRQNAELVALRVTENAGRSGEHYITETRTDYFAMLKAAAGGGAAVAFIAAMKIHISTRDLAPLAEVLANCLNYGLGFVLIHLLHFSVATKQPAMTANAIAAAIGNIQDNSRDRQRDLEPLVTLIACTIRTQLAAIVGNIGLAIPSALLIAYLIQYFSGNHFITPAKAQHLLKDIDLFSLGTLIFAGIAGVCLFMAGLIAGYYDNLCSYSRIPERLNRLPWAKKLFGQERWQRVSEYIRNNLGFLAGNFLLGFLLGGITGLGMLLGLPLDVRHTTLSSAMWGYSLFALDFNLPWQLITTTALGCLGIGIVNLGVSFYLALAVALRARGVDFTQRIGLMRALLRRFVSHPSQFFLPPKKTPKELS